MNGAERQRFTYPACCSVSARSNDRWNMSKRKSKALSLVVDEERKTANSKYAEWIAADRASLLTKFPDPAARLFHLAGNWNTPSIWEALQASMKAFFEEYRSFLAIHKQGSTITDWSKVCVLDKRQYEFQDLSWQINELEELILQLNHKLLDDYGPRFTLGETFTANERAINVNKVWVKLYADNLPPSEPKDKSPIPEYPLNKLGSPPTLLQMTIWKQLRYKGLKKDQLAKACGVDPSRLYCTNRNEKSGGLTEMMNVEIVVNKPGLGYYRPDSPPKIE